MNMEKSGGCASAMVILVNSKFNLDLHTYHSHIKIVCTEVKPLIFMKILVALNLLNPASVTG